MNGNHRFYPSLGAFRPWPFGPPLRGRAPRAEARVPAAHGQANARESPPASGSGVQTVLLVGGHVWAHPVHSA